MRKNSIVFAFCLLLFAFMLTGCSKTVTQIVTYGDQMVVEVTLRGTMETGANRYFLILASNESYKIPLPAPDNIDYEFLEPGMLPQLQTQEAYYANFYSTWAGYVMVEPGGFFLAKGPFVINQTVTCEMIAGPGETSSKITFHFSLSKIFGDNIPNPIYFDFVTVSWPIGNAKTAKDHLTSTNAYISKVTGSSSPINDEENSALDPALDIKACTVTIQ